MIINNVSAILATASAADHPVYTAASWPCPGCESDIPADPAELVRVLYVHRAPICFVLCPQCERTLAGSNKTKRRVLETKVRKACTKLFMESLTPAGSA